MHRLDGGALFVLLVITWISVILAQKELGDVDLGCPKATYKFGNFCYSLVTLSANYDDAELACESGGGYLATIKDWDTYLFIQKLRIRKFAMNYWIGLNDRQKEGIWVHSDNTRLQGFQKWFPGEPNNAYNQHCAMMWMLRSLLWDDDNCNKKFLYVCQASGSNCSDISYSFGPYCYELSSELATYDEADFRCKQKGGTLVNVKTKDINDLVKKLIYAERRWKDLTEKDVLQILRETGTRMPSSWLGLRYVNGDWLYSDGTSLGTFSKWGQGEPNNAKMIEDCVMTGQEWYDVSCDNIRSFFCQYPVSSSDTNTPCSETSVSSKSISTTPRTSLLFKLVTRKSKAVPLVQDIASKDTNGDSNILITSTQLTFALIGCVVFGGLLAFLILTVIYIRRRNSLRDRGERFRDEQDTRMLEHEITNQIFLDKGFGPPSSLSNDYETN